jgi:hypothetical protein
MNTLYYFPVDKILGIVADLLGECAEKHMIKNNEAVEIVKM